MFNRLNRAVQRALDPDKVGEVHGRQPTPESLVPGDVVSFADGFDAVVQTVLPCREELNNRVTEWRWNLLDQGRLLETSPEGRVLYTRTALVHQGSAEFETLTCDPDQGGVLKEFEARVRAGTAGRN